MDRRTALLASQWSPLQARPAAWYYAAGQFVSLDALTVIVWADRTSQGNDLIQGTSILRPSWEATAGWSADKPSIRASTQWMETAPGSPIASMFSGANVAFTVLATVEVITAASAGTVAAWASTDQQNREQCNVTSSRFMQVLRADSDTTLTTTATASPTSGHARLAFTFDGTTGRAYLGNLLVASGTIAGAPVEPLTFDFFTIGASGMDVRYTEVVAYPRALAPEEVRLYSAYSLNEWGP